MWSFSGKLFHVGRRLIKNFLENLANGRKSQKITGNLYKQKKQWGSSWEHSSFTGFYPPHLVQCVLHSQYYWVNRPTFHRNTRPLLSCRSHTIKQLTRLSNLRMTKRKGKMNYAVVWNPLDAIESSNWKVPSIPTLPSLDVCTQGVHWNGLFAVCCKSSVVSLEDIS